jgi:glycosyltransferase involved in cell wall biosynthesis
MSADFQVSQRSTDDGPAGRTSFAAKPTVAPQPDLSIVVAIYNEQESLRPLASEIVAAMDALGRTWECVLVDDGSRDGSRETEKAICRDDARFRAIQLRRNFGKAAALSVGFRHARGRYVVTMDGDLQDDPAEVANLLAPIERGEADLVSGWKFRRLDPASKTIPSKVYNYFSRLATGLDLHDMNCGLKAYRAEVVKQLALYGDMHRYIPVLAAGMGYVVTEVKTNHRPRVHGHSKYAAGRFVRGFLDLLTVVFLTRYLRRPLHLIGSVAIVTGALGVAILLYLSAIWFAGYGIGQRPLLFLGILLVLVSGQLVTFGLLAEMLTYFFHRDRNDYNVLAVHETPPDGHPAVHGDLR